MNQTISQLKQKGKVPLQHEHMNGISGNFRMLFFSLMLVAALSMVLVLIAEETEASHTVYVGMWDYTSDSGLDGIGQGENDIYFEITIKNSSTGNRLSSAASYTYEDADNGNFSFDVDFDIDNSYEEIVIVIALMEEDSGSDDDIVDIDNSATDNGYTSLTVLFDFESQSWTGDDEGDKSHGSQTSGNGHGDGDGSLSYNIWWTNDVPSVEMESPSNGGTFYDSSMELKFNISDANSDDLTYNLYFDINSNPTTLVIENETGDYSHTYLAEGLSRKQMYYWKVVVHDGYASTESDIWGFYVGNHVPKITQYNASIDWNNKVMINYNFHDEDYDDLTFDIYLDNKQEPTILFAESLTPNTSSTYDVGILDQAKTYYWKIVVTDGYDTNETTVSEFYLPDISPPVIEYHISSEDAIEGISIVINATITDNGLGVQGATLYYCCSGETDYLALTMNKGGDTYSAIIPKDKVVIKDTDEEINIYIRATDGENVATGETKTIKMTPPIKDSDDDSNFIPGFEVTMIIAGIGMVLVLLNRKKQMDSE